LLVCCASIGAGGHRGVWGVVREGGRQKKEGRATGLDVEMTTVVELAAAAPSPLIHLKGIITLIEKAVTKKEMRLMARAIRQILAVRHRLKASTVSSFLKHALPTSSEALSRLLSFVAKVEMGEASMEVDTPSPPSSTSQSQPSYKQSVLPELESFSYLLVIIFLIDHKHLEDVCLFTCTF